MTGYCLRRPRNVVGTVGFLLVTTGLLGSVAAFVVLGSYLLEMHEIIPGVPATPVEWDDDWWTPIVILWCCFGVMIVGTIASLVGLRWKPRKLASWGAAIGLMVMLAVSIKIWWPSTG